MVEVIPASRVFLIENLSRKEFYADLVALTTTGRTPREGKARYYNPFQKRKKAHCTFYRKRGPARRSPLTIRRIRLFVLIAQNVTDGHENNIPTASLSSWKIRSRTRTRAWAAVSLRRNLASSASPPRRRRPEGIACVEPPGLGGSSGMRWWLHSHFRIWWLKYDIIWVHRSMSSQQFSMSSRLFDETVSDNRNNCQRAGHQGASNYIIWSLTLKSRAYKKECLGFGNWPASVFLYLFDMQIPHLPVQCGS
jgi:hypothetical protein